MSGKRAGSRFTAQEIQHIRSSSKPGYVLAQMYGVTPPLISQIRNHKIYRYVQ